MTDQLDHYIDVHAGKSRDELAVRREQVITRIAELEGYPRRSQAQVAELGDLFAEQLAVDDYLSRADVEIRRSQLDAVRQAAQDPRNRESGYDGGGEYVPAGRRTLRGTRGAGSGSVRRSDRMWVDLAGDAWASGSMVSRAFDALDSYPDDEVSRAGRERVAELFGAESEEQTQASRLAVALTDPAYRTAYETVMRHGAQFGPQYWSPRERDAAERVATLMRSGTLGTGSLGWALPLDLDPTVRLVNAGSANPWRELSTPRTTTSNFWRGLTSTGAAAAWLGEAAAATDGTPTLLNMDITPVKAAAWLFGSYESVGWQENGADGDTAFASNLSTFLTDAKDQLEVAAFTTGATGTGQPTGLMTAMATGSDLVLGTGAWTFTGVAALKEGVPPRFRLGAGAKTAWLANLTYVDKLLQVPAFTGSLTTLVDSSGPVPRMLGSSIYECSAMATGTAAGTRVLLYGDFSQNYIVDRWPGFTLFEPMLKGTGASAQLPTGQAGWFYVWRTGMGQTSTGAWRVGKN
jgi:HK97 family phage major capsid protein